MVISSKTSTKPVPKTFAFIDASNIIYGTRDENWKVDFEKLMKYLREKHGCRRVYYFAGEDKNNEKQQSFYKKLKKIGYLLVLKPIKKFTQANGKTIWKANCDVDLTFFAMKDKDLFNRGIFFSGDGDFLILLEYFIEQKKEVVVFANSLKTAREIKRVKSLQFNDLSRLKAVIEKQKK